MHSGAAQEIFFKSKYKTYFLDSGEFIIEWNSKSKIQNSRSQPKVSINCSSEGEFDLVNDIMAEIIYLNKEEFERFARARK